MRRNYWCFSLLFAILLLLAACSKGSNDEDDDFKPYMEVRINNGERIVTKDINQLGEMECGWLGCSPGKCIYGVRGNWIGVSGIPDQHIQIEFANNIELGIDVTAQYLVFDEDIQETISYWTIDYCEDSERPNGYNIYNDISLSINPLGNNRYRGTFSFEVSNNCRESVIVIEGEFGIKSEIPICE